MENAQQNKENRFGRSLRRLGHQFWEWKLKNSFIISSLALIGLAIIDISDINEWKINAFGSENFKLGLIIYLIIVLFAIIFGIYSVSNASEIKFLEEKNIENDLKISSLESLVEEVVNQTNELFNSYLKLVSINLDFKYTERLSVYKVYDSKFKMIGRTSENPTLAKPGRSDYDINEGFIGKGWSEGEFYIDNLPNPETNGGNDYYNKIIQKVNINRSILESLNMKSRTYLILRIDGFDSAPKAILVAESVKAKGFSKSEIKNKLDEVSQPLVMFIEKLNPSFENLDESVKNVLGI